MSQQAGPRPGLPSMTQAGFAGVGPLDAEIDAHSQGIPVEGNGDTELVYCKNEARLGKHHSRLRARARLMFELNIARRSCSRSNRHDGVPPSSVSCSAWAAHEQEHVKSGGHEDGRKSPLLLPRCSRFICLLRLRLHYPVRASKGSRPKCQVVERHCGQRVRRHP